MKRSPPVVLVSFVLAGCGSSAGSPMVCPPTPQVIVAPPTLLSPQSGASGIAYTGLTAGPTSYRLGTFTTANANGTAAAR